VGWSRNWTAGIETNVIADEITKDLSDSEKLNLILATLAAMDVRMVKVEAFVEDRSRPVQPRCIALQSALAIEAS